ncbi:amidohydrolase [Allostreptomyces psammosilenae]|uniref:Amidohydrolase 3 domain-containing protein n=1 Tax=Allostreptomyces psammosilenae TaxID=1892865 RepID=A0A852ZP90_9ACTN|nr:amidohydrolase [Allostreptomyces psammosilenae]NYI04266.1 hypothetical protein [Allostreptomyces psammosilenae]
MEARPSQNPTATPTAARNRPAAAARTVLLRGGTVHSPADPFATALVVEDGTVAWVGAEGAADAHAGAVDAVVDLRGRLVTPAFVDAHVHTTMTGLSLTGLDLTGCDSAADLLDRLARHARATTPGTILVGHGWDDSRWTRPGLPTAADLDRVTGGAPVLLTRVDAHSALASTALLRLAPEAADLPGHGAGGLLTAAAHHAARRAVEGALTAAQRAEAQRAALARAASLGIAAVHECAGPDISSEEDLRALLELAAGQGGEEGRALPEVVAYWGETAGALGTASAVGERVRDLGARGLGGDLFVDGSLGSRTAALRTPYSDPGCLRGHRGTFHLTPEAIAEHLRLCTEAGVQAGFHAIGDAAVDAVLDGLEETAERLGLPAVRALRHRVEHAELLDDSAVARCAALGVVLSVQPAFDAAWGAPGGMYERRLGAERAARMNPFAALLRAGVPLAFGSDAPVTPLGPWETVRAAAFHHRPEHRISARAAFSAHTRGGHRAVGDDLAGVLVPGAPAHLAVWRAGELVVQAPDARVAGWSTDPRSGTPGLPDVHPDAALPDCVATLVAGRPAHVAADAAEFAEAWGLGG